MNNFWDTNEGLKQIQGADWVMVWPGDIAAGEVTYGELFAVQPFSNVMTVQTCTGQQIHDLLEQQFYPDPDDDSILQVSTGFSYAWDPAAPLGDRVDIGSIMLGGNPIDPAVGYRVAMNNFLPANIGTLVMLLMFVAILGIGMASVSHVYSFAAQREREKELLWAGFDMVSLAEEVGVIRAGW